MKRSGKSIKKIYIIQLCIGAVLLIVLMVLLVVYKGGLQSYEPKEETVQFMSGTEITHDKSSVFSKEEGILKIKGDEREDSTLISPIIHKNNAGRKITIAENMMYTDPEFSEVCNRLNYFTSLMLEDGLVIIEKDGKRAFVSGGYLFNGVNTYIFLEDCELQIGVNKVEIPALSYVNASYRSEVELYNSKTGQCEYYYLGGMDSYINMGDKYTLDIGRDVLIKNDKESLIFTAVDGLDVLPLN